MSKYRPGARDLKEVELQSLIRGNAMSEKELVEECRVLQRQIDRIETPRLNPAVPSAADSEDSEIERLPDGTAAINEDEAPSEFGAAGIDWKMRAGRTMALMLGVLRQVSQSNEPRLQAYVALLAVGDPGAPSMRQLATTYNRSPERISQLVEEMQKRHNLPRNERNKSAAAVISYRFAAKQRGAA